MQNNLKSSIFFLVKQKSEAAKTWLTSTVSHSSQRTTVDGGVLLRKDQGEEEVKPMCAILTSRTATGVCRSGLVFGPAVAVNDELQLSIEDYLFLCDSIRR